MTRRIFAGGLTPVKDFLTHDVLVIRPKSAHGCADSKANNKTQSAAKFAEKTCANPIGTRSKFLKGKNMQTIIILLDPKNLENPVTDLSYNVPVEIEKATGNKVYDNGYDYLDNDIMMICLETENAEEWYPKVLKLLKEKDFYGNDLSKTAEIYISEEECADLEECCKVYPE